MTKVCITGAAGFIGSWLTIYLLENTNLEVIVLDRLDGTVNLDRLGNNKIWRESKRKEFIWWDLKAPLSEIVINKLKGVDTIIHCASQSHVDRSISDPYTFTMDNVLGTTNLLEFIRSNTTRLIHVSTDEVLGSALEDYSFNTLDTPNPENPYAATKLAQEALIRAYACTYDMQACIIRLTNIIGPAQAQEKFLPKAIRLLLQTKPVQLHTSPTGKISTRYYLDIRDLCIGIHKLITLNKIEYISKKVRASGIYHFSGNKEIDNLTIATKLSLLLKKPLEYELVTNTNDRRNPDIAYRLDDTLTRDMLNWKPRFSLDESLEHITNWYLSNIHYLNIN